VRCWEEVVQDVKSEMQLDQCQALVQILVTARDTSGQVLYQSPQLPTPWYINKIVAASPVTDCDMR
jgi:hypothetical protein